MNTVRFLPALLAIALAGCGGGGDERSARPDSGGCSLPEEAESSRGTGAPITTSTKRQHDGTLVTTESYPANHFWKITCDADGRFRSAKESVVTITSSGKPFEQVIQGIEREPDGRLTYVLVN